MIEGIAASISMAVPSGRRSHTGESSVRNMAMPNDTGTAMTSAISEVSSVPVMGTSAPKMLRTGSQSLVQRKLSPYSAMDSRLPQMSDSMMPASSMNTRNAKERGRFLNNRSISALE